VLVRARRYRVRGRFRVALGVAGRQRRVKEGGRRRALARLPPAAYRRGENADGVRAANDYQIGVRGACAY